MTMRFPPYEKSHIVALIGTVLSVVVLIITVYCVWYPYLQTQKFIPAECIPYKVNFYGPVTCHQQSSSTCSTLPPLSEVTDYFNFTTWPATSASTSTVTSLMSTSSTTSETTIKSSPVTSPVSTASTTWSSGMSTIFSSATPTSTFTGTSGTSATPTRNSTGNSTEYTNSTEFVTATVVNGTGRRKRGLAGENTSVVTLPPVGTYCTSFPCIEVMVDFRTTFGRLILSSGFLFSDYDQLQSYPRCSYSSCGSSNVENYKSVTDQFNATITAAQFPCYVNLYTNPFMILEQVNFSYAAAVNSILWPILALLFFGTLLLCMRGNAWYRLNFTGAANRSSATTGREIPFAVHYVDMPPAAVTSFSPPSLPNDGMVMGLPETNEKNPAMFLEGGFAGVNAVDPAIPSQWAVGYLPNPPKYEEAGFSVTDSYFDMPSNAASAIWTPADGASATTADSDGGNSYKY